MGTGASAKVGECDAFGGRDAWGLMTGAFRGSEWVEPKSSALLGEIRKDDCHNEPLVKSLGITRWVPESSREES